MWKTIIEQLRNNLFLNKFGYVLILEYRVLKLGFYLNLLSLKGKNTSA